MSLWAWLYGPNTFFDEVEERAELTDSPYDVYWPERDYFDAERNAYVTGDGRTLVGIHPVTDTCFQRGCVIHNPTEHAMRDLPTHWRDDRGIMERTCPHGVGHPDPDDLAFQEECHPHRAAGVHGCDGCCGWDARRQRDLAYRATLTDDDMDAVTHQLLGSAA
jgi:hypothetical protein